MKDKPTKVDDMQHLTRLCLEGNDSFFIALSFSRSSKTMQYDEEDKIFTIHNEIDDTWQDLTEEELSTESNIGNAIEKGAFYMY